LNFARFYKGNLSKEKSWNFFLEGLQSSDNIETAIKLKVCKKSYDNLLTKIKSDKEFNSSNKLEYEGIIKDIMSEYRPTLELLENSIIKMQEDF
jgi:hypothetical protein